MAQGKKVSQKALLKAIPGTAGVISEICRRVGIARNTFYARLESDAKVAAAYEDERETVLDMGEGRLFEAVNNGESWAIMFLLSRKGKERGYSERVENDVKFTGGVLRVPGMMEPEQWEDAVHGGDEQTAGK